VTVVPSPLNLLPLSLLTLWIDAALDCRIAINVGRRIPRHATLAGIIPHATLTSLPHPRINLFVTPPRLSPIIPRLCFMPDDQLVQDMIPDAFSHTLLIQLIFKMNYKYIRLRLLPFHL